MEESAECRLCRGELNRDLRYETAMVFFHVRTDGVCGETMRGMNIKGESQAEGKKKRLF